jgi:photosystem II stability/assembly factor-like uncharacterized protein
MDSTKTTYTLLILIFFFVHTKAQESIYPIPDFLEYRNMGPHRVGSWISHIAVPESEDPAYAYTYYIGSRNGGVWKTINNGTTFFPVFDSLGIGSIGAIAISKSNPEVVWVGTGEAFCTRSSHAGRGVFKSMDAGKTWISCGLENTHHISAVIIHPENPNIVFVAAMGHLFTPNKERGIFKTTDGGSTWEKVMYIDENTGVIDMIMHPDLPDVLLAAAYEKYRYPWHYEAGGKQSGIYRTLDQGASWQKLTEGLPVGKIGRIGLGLCYNKPETVYAVIENLNPKEGVVVDEDIEMNYMRDPYYDQLIGGEVYRSDDSGDHWVKQNQDSCNVSAKAAYSFNKILVHPDDPDRIFVSSDLLVWSADGGRTWNDCNWPPEQRFVNMFGDIRTFWADPKNGNHMMIGSDGGLYETFDGGKSMYHHDQIPLGEIYQVETDNAYPYNIYLGLQDHEAWKAPSNSWSGRIGSEDWNLVGLWDGMYSVVDPEDNRWLYISTQFGAHHRVDQKLGTRVKIEPKASEGEPAYRFPWTPPIEISYHNTATIYIGAQCLLKSNDRGDHWKEISPDLTTNVPEKIAGRGHMMYCTITAISESKIVPGQIWIGTDDGRIHMTNNDGVSWIEFTDHLHDLGGDRDYWVSRVLASQHDQNRAYISKSGFKSDDFRPLVFRTDDRGKTWKVITSGLPMSPVNVIIEDPKNEDLLYLGNDEGVFISFVQGDHWQSFKQNMPVVPVKDLTIQSEENDLIVGTFGRGAYVIDVSLIQQYDQNLFSKDFLLFDIEPKPVRNYSQRAYWGNYEMNGDNHLFTPNEPNGWVIYFALNKLSIEQPMLEITDGAGLSLDTLGIDQKTGFQQVIYDTYELQPGIYRCRLMVNGRLEEKGAVLKPSPVWPVGHGLINE